MKFIIPPTIGKFYKSATGGANEYIMADNGTTNKT